MAAEFGIEMVGDRKVALRFEKFPEELRTHFAAPIKSITARLGAAVRANTPRGVEGELPGLVIEQFYDDPDQVSGRVTFTDEFAKVGALEYGAPGPRDRNMVKAHRAKLTHVFGSRLQRPLIVMVAAHRRQLNVKENKMLRGPVADMQGAALSELRAVVDAQVDKDE